MNKLPAAMYLVAEGTAVGQRWRRPLPDQRTVIVGREAGPWSADWDGRISRRHLQLTRQGDELEITRIADAKNPVFHRGRPVERVRLRPGEHVVIGQTTFTFSAETAEPTVELPQPAAERTFDSDRLRQMPFENAAVRIEALSRLGERLAGARDEEELADRAVATLLEGIPQAAVAALVSRDAADGGPRVRHFDHREIRDQSFRPSRRLIERAWDRDESVLHLWTDATPGEFTLIGEQDWAFCTPLAESEGGPAWGLYVTGRFAGPPLVGDGEERLRDDLKFAEIVSATLSSVRRLRRLERRQAGLRQFFAPVVLDAMAGADPDEALAPREADLTVLFCDLRGFTRRSEEQADDLLGLLARVGDALGVATAAIRETGGVVGDFHGDAVMGFWGWPLHDTAAPQAAAAAALAIRRQLLAASARPEHPLHAFRLGLGLASGRGVAGAIGTADQAKVTAFGPVVNRAARLESLTKQIRAPILMDEATAEALRRGPEGVARVRRIATVLPYGLTVPVEVSELRPPVEEDPELTDEQLAAYEAAVEAVRERDWERAVRLLHEAPAEDRAKDFLLMFIVQHGRVPPDGFNGVIPLTTK